MESLTELIVGCLILGVSFVLGWLFGRLNWKVWHASEKHLKKSFLFFPWSYKKRLIKKNDAPNMVCIAQWHAQDVHFDDWLGHSFKIQKYARNEYCMFMSVFWTFKIVWNILLIAGILLNDLFRDKQNSKPVD